MFKYPKIRQFKNLDGFLKKANQKRVKSLRQFPDNRKLTKEELNKMYNHNKNEIVNLFSPEDLHQVILPIFCEDLKWY